MFRTLFTGFLCFGLLAACSAPETKQPVMVADSTAVSVPVQAYRYEVFSNVDSMGQTHGYGYDIFLGDKKLIHQTNIPGEPGLDGFVSEGEAEIIAKVVIEKLNVGGGFPTLSRTELIDYGITLKQ